MDAPKPGKPPAEPLLPDFSDEKDQGEVQEAFKAAKTWWDTHAFIERVARAGVREGTLFENCFRKLYTMCADVLLGCGMKWPATGGRK